MDKLESGEYAYQYLFYETQDVEFIHKQNVDLLELYKSKIADGNLIKPEIFIKLLPLEYHNYVTDFITHVFSVYQLQQLISHARSPSISIQFFRHLQNYSSQNSRNNIFCFVNLILCF